MAATNGETHQPASTATGSALDMIKDELPNGFKGQSYSTTNWASPGQSEYNFYSEF